MMTSEGAGIGSKVSSANNRIAYSAVQTDATKIENVDRTLSLRRTFKVSWWERRTGKEKKLIVCLPVLVVVILVIIAVFSSVLARPTAVELQGNASVLTASSTQVETCVTWECVTTAAAMMESMDRSVDPCLDFYKFACGSQPRGLDTDSASTHFARIGFEQDKQLKDLLEAPDSTDQIEAIRKVKTLYKLCYEESTFEWIEESIWFDEDLLAAKNRSNIDLTSFLAKLRLLTADQGIFSFYVEADAKNSNKNVIYFDQPRRLLYIPSMNFNRSENSGSVHSSMYSRVLPLVVPDKNGTIEMLNDVMTIDAELRKIFVPATYRRNQYELYNRMTVADMHRNLTEKIDWLKFLRVIFESVNMTVDYDEEVVVLVPEFFTKLGELLNRVSSKAVVAYLFLGMHAEISDEFSKNLPFDIPMGHDSIVKEFLSYRCVRFIKNNFEMAVSRLYLDEYFRKGSIEKINAMVEEIREAFGRLVDEATWVDEESKKLIKEKAEVMESKVGFPGEIFNDTHLNGIYGDLNQFLTKNFTENAISIRKTVLRQSFANLRKPVDKTRWLAPPITVNAFYVAIRNEIIIPASIIQPPFYKDIDFSRVLNFGGIGYVIGHEITHGFGNKGRQFDKWGQLSVWWPHNMTADFDERIKCFVNKYNNYSIFGVQIDGLRTLDENLADDGGLRVSFRAYRDWVSRQGREEPVLPGLGLTGNQLFFLQFAQAMCSRPQYEYYTSESAKTSVHCPSEIRVLGTLSNSKDFAEAYGCRTGSRMNPEKEKCRIW